MTNPTAAVLLKPEWPVAETKEQKLQKWLDAKKLLDAAKDAEMTARKEVVASFPFPADVKEGTHRVPLAAGWQLKVVLKQNYSLSKDSTDAALAAYEQAAKNEVDRGRREMEVQALVSWKPELSIAAYREAPPELLDFIKDSLKITDGAPALELVEPKKK